MIPVRLHDIRGRSPLVRPDGGLMVGPPANDDVAQETLGTDDAVVIIITPKADQGIVITGMIVSTSRDVGVNGANVDIYFDGDKTQAVIANPIWQPADVAKNTTVVATPVNIEVPKGNYVLAKTDDDDVNVTLFFHRGPI